MSGWSAPIGKTIIGAETAAFVLLFQVQNGPVPDAVVGPATHKALDAIASVVRKVAAVNEVGELMEDLAALRPEDREQIKTLPGGIAADFEQLTSDQ